MTTESYSLPVSMLRQWVYCPRIVFFNEVLRVVTCAPPLVAQGVDLHRRYSMLERRRGLSRYGLEGFEKLFAKPMKSVRLGIHGIVDGVLVGKESVHVMEFKPERRQVPQGHLLQTMGYGLLAEEHIGLPLGGIHILHGERGRTVSVVGEQLEPLRLMTLAAIEAARKMIEEAIMPSSSAGDMKCAQCEYLNFCNDREISYELQ